MHVTTVAGRVAFRAALATAVAVGALLSETEALAQEPADGSPELIDLGQLEPSARFDFLLGDWTYEFANGHGRAEYTEALDGEAIRESLEGVFGESEFAGASLAIYDEDAGVWRRKWIDTLGHSLDAIDRMEDYEVSTLPAMVSEFELQGTLFKHIWYDISEDRFETDLLISSDGGESYQLARRAPYTRSSPH